MKSPVGGNVCPRSHRSTLRYADAAGSHTCVVTVDSRYGLKNTGDSVDGHDVVDAQYGSPGGSGYRAHRPNPRFVVANTTRAGALPAPSDPARVLYSMWSRVADRS